MNKGFNKPARINLWARLIKDVRLLFSLIRDYCKGTYRDVTIRSVALFLAAITYLFCPVDIISDFIPVLGQMDDAGILLLCLYLLETDLYKYESWKERNKNST